MRDFWRSSGYLATFQTATVALPPLFLDQMAHVIMRNLLSETADGPRARRRRGPVPRPEGDP